MRQKEQNREEQTFNKNRNRKAIELEIERHAFKAQVQSDPVARIAAPGPPSAAHSTVSVDRPLVRDLCQVLRKRI